VTLAGGEASLSLRGNLKGGNVATLVWKREGAPIASGTLDAAFDLTGRGRSTAGIVAALAGSGSFSVDAARIEGVDPDALNAVMALAGGDTEPDEAKARETFAQLFGADGLDLGHVEGSFSVADGVVSVPTVSMAADAASVLADGAFDLNAFTLASQWQVRSGEGSGDEQPSVRLRFFGAIDDPARSVDVDPLLDAMRSRFLQRQLKELETLEAAQKAREAERKAEAEAEAERQAEAARQAEAERKAQEVEQPPPVFTPEAQPSLPEAQSPPADQPDASPLQLPEPPAAPAPLPEPAPKRRAEPVAPAPAPPPAYVPPPSPEYRVLPNGVIIKKRG
jgi:large subunit ribosomal protein L24